MSNVLEIKISENRNEIFYSLAQHEIFNIKNQIINSDNESNLNIIINFDHEELDKIFKLLSTTYKFKEKEKIISSIWETFLCNKIINELQKKETIYYSQNLDKERNILFSFDINRYLIFFDKRTTLSILNQIIKNQITKNVKIHYFPDQVIMPIDLQKVINNLFSSELSFSNILYTSKNSLCSYYKKNGEWSITEENYKEIWKAQSSIAKENFLYN